MSQYPDSTSVVVDIDNSTTVTAIRELIVRHKCPQPRTEEQLSECRGFYADHMIFIGPAVRNRYGGDPRNSNSPYGF